MSRNATVWRVRPTQAADDDFRRIITWTTREFGEQQARVYAETLKQTLSDLTEGPALAGLKVRDDIAHGILTIHVARKGRKGRHIVMVQVADCSEHVIDVLRILHDSMDLPRHFSPNANDAD